MAAAQLTNTNNYAGDILEELYLVLSTGFTSKEKELVRTHAGVAKSLFLPKITAADDPLMAYSEGAPATQSATVTYAERELATKKAQLYIEFIPEDFLEMWPFFRSVGNFTNLALNPKILMATLQTLGRKVGKQMEKLLWQGDTGGATAISYFDGFITLALADAAVTDVANIGVITTSNVFDILEDVWNAIPEQVFDDPGFKILFSFADWKKLQAANNAVKQSTVGVLSETIQKLFLENKLDWTSGIPENTIYAAVATMDPASNLNYGVYVEPMAEMNAARIMRVANNSDTWFIRVNFKASAQHREGAEIVMYQGS